MISSKKIAERAIQCYPDNENEKSAYIQGASMVKATWCKLQEEDVKKMAKWFLQGSDFQNFSDFLDERDRIECLKEFYYYLNSDAQ